MLFFSLLILQGLLRLNPTSATATCNQGTNCTQGQAFKITCNKFNSWTEVNTQFSSNNCTIPIDQVFLKPSEPILLTGELNISLMAYSNPAVFTTNQLVLYSVRGVNVFPWPPLTCSGCAKKNLAMYLSTVEFYVNNTPPGAYTCGPGLVPDDSSQNVSLFSSYLIGFFVYYGNTYGTLSQSVCPFLFKNAQLYEMLLEYQVDSFLFVSLFKFQNDEISTNYTTIGSSIGQLDVSGYNYKLDTSLVNPLVFEQLTTFTCFGTINSIQVDMFTYLGRVTLTLNMNSLGNFYHRIGLTWMNYLSINSSVTLTSVFAYTYPDKDFCIFSELPLNRSIQLLLDNPGSNVTLTYKWLCNITTFTNDKIDSQLKLCKLESAENNQNHDALNNNPFYPDFYQTKLIDMFLIQTVPFVCIPCACLIGLFLNWKIIQTIKTNEKKELKEDFYKYMSANAKFNCLYCIICVFYPMTSCNWRLSSYFCSSVFTSLFVQYYKILIVAYVGEVVKMCANVSYLMMTLNRYLLVGKDHAPWLVLIAKLKFKWVIRGSLLFSALINIGHGWEYEAVEDLTVSNVYISFSSYAIINGHSYSDYPEANQSLTYFFFSIGYFVVNFVVFFVANTGIEGLLVWRMHKELREKRERMIKMNAANSVSSNVRTISNAAHRLSQTDEGINERNEAEDAKKERRVVKMVVLNSIFNLILRAPDLLFWIENVNIWCALFICNNKRITFGLFVPGLLGLLADIGYLTYILTFTTNFVIFFKFNKKFKKAVAFF
jgi:hypothetical protein